MAAPRLSNRRMVYETLRRQIVSLELAPGVALSENELATKLSLSRTPVREGLILLQDEGLVQIFPKLGSFVARIDPAKVATAQFIREAIELASVADAVERASAEAIAELHAQIAGQRQASSIDSFFELDEQFHHRLLAAGGHESAWRTVVGAKAHLDRARRLGLLGDRSIASLVDEHELIVDALVKRDVEATRDALRAHVRKVFADITSIRRERPELFAAPDSEARPTRRVVSTWD